jgi:hypothetical protein
MKASGKIMAVLGTVLVVLVAVIFLSTKRSAHFDNVALEKDGVVMDANIETLQFSNGDSLYRMWNKDEMISVSSSDEKRQILSDNILFFEDESILFTNEFTVVKTDGLTEKTKSRKVYDLNGQGTYVTKSSTIAESSIVKLAQRTYFLNASATVYFGDEEVTTVERPLLLIDKTGSVIVYDAPTKKRYLGHLTLQIDKNKRVDVSDEKYYVDDRVIDLASFGGTDNQKLVVDSSSSTKESKDKDKDKDKENDKDKEKDKTKDSASGENKDSSESNNPATGDGSTGGQSDGDGSGSSDGSGQGESGTGENNSGVNNNLEQAQNSGALVALKDYEDILEKIKELNKKSTKSIPILTLNYINPEVTSLSYSYQILDVDDTLVGSTKVELLNARTDELVDTAYIDSKTSVETFNSLSPNTTYYLRFTYQYDLGEGNGVQSLEVKSNVFETEKVEPVYQLKNVDSTTMTVRASLDQQMSDLNRASLKVLGEDGNSFSIEGNINLIMNGGQDFQINGLAPKTKYSYQLELSLKSGETILLNKSSQYQTLEGTRMRALNASVTPNNLIEVTYDFSSVEYNVLETEVQLTNTKTNEVIPHQVVEQNEQTVTVVPLIKTNATSFSVQLDLKVEHTDSDEVETLSYEDDTLLSYKKNAVMKIYQADQSASNTFSNLSNSLVMKNVNNVIPETKSSMDSQDVLQSETEESTFESDAAEIDEAVDEDLEDEDLEEDEAETFDYICSLVWQSPVENTYTVVTECREKQLVSDLLPVEEDEDWLIYDTQDVNVNEHKQLSLEQGLSKLAMQKYNFRQAIYDKTGTLIMYLYPR